MIAFLGTGLLGSNFVRSLISKGNTVQVWNRTASKAEALETYGATAFFTPADAVNGADMVHLTLKDDQTVDEVIALAAPGLKQGAILIDHTTTSAAGAVERTKRLKEQGFEYLHAPVFMGPQNALEATGYMLASGNQELISQLEAHLSTMTGKLVNLGPEEGKAAGLKLTGNLFLMTLTAGAVDALALARSMNIEPNDVLEFFTLWNPGASAPARMKKVISGDFSSPSWELSMARKDAGLMLDAAALGNKTLNLIPSIAKVMDQKIAEGHGNQDWTVIGKDL